MKKLLLLKIAANNKAIKNFNLYFRHFTTNLKRQGGFQSLMNNTD